MSSRSGSSRPWRWALPLVLALFFSFCIAQRAQPQETSESELKQRIESLRLHLQTIIASARSLEDESETWKRLSEGSEQRANELLRELTEVRRELETWQSESGELQRQLQELKELHAQSEAKLKQALETSRRSSDSWAAALDQATRERRQAVVKTAIITGGAGVLLGVILTSVTISLLH